jgi:hypothetical protein
MICITGGACGTGESAALALARGGEKADSRHPRHGRRRAVSEAGAAGREALSCVLDVCDDAVSTASLAKLAEGRSSAAPSHRP